MIENIEGFYRFWYPKWHYNGNNIGNQQKSAHETYKKYGAITCVFDYLQFES